MHSSTAPPPQYATGVPAHHMTTPGEWSTGLCDCTKDMSSSCSISGALYSILCLFTGCECIYSFMYRSKLRQQYMLTEQPCNDCLVRPLLL
ncbi:PLAC8 motif-containing protein [Artemisia annua]|uniref:PLAC8 motif-containing protein n=1 Tax=Artemisia annua TaxID=35608 RepID=A0A2U1LRT9_ARTAN|nr:PLAC8 motif-containing protein [Artemisia annua]